MVETQDKLITLLSHKKDLMEQVIPFLEEEHRCIMALDMDRLSEVMERKSELLSRLQDAGNQCRSLVQKLGAELGVAEAKSLSPLLPRLEQPQQEELRGLQGALLQAGARFEQLLRHNGDLLGGALTTVNRSLEFFGRLLNRNATYGGAGRMIDGANRSRIVCREI